jgi:hypothetical protein
MIYDNHQTKTRKETLSPSTKLMSTQNMMLTRGRKRQIPSRQTMKKNNQHPCLKLKKRKDKHNAMMDEKMKRLFATFTENTQKQLTKQAEKHAIQIAEMKKTTIEAQNLSKKINMATQRVNDHRESAHFNVMIKSCEVLFDG